MSDLGPANKLMCLDDDSSEDSDGEDANAMEVPPPRLKSSCLEDLCDCLENRGFTKEANSSHSLLDDLARLQRASLTKQTSVTDYF